MSRVTTSDTDVDVDLSALFSSLARNWLRILLIALVVSVVAIMLASVATPKYRAETRILIETRESVFTRPEGDRSGDRPILDEEGVTSQVEVIGSADLLKQVALKLNLAEREEFDAAARMSMLGNALVILGLKADPIEIPPEERVLEAFRDKLNVYRVKNSRVIVVEFSSEDPKLAARVADAVAEAYIALQRDAKLQSDTDATAWLEPEITSLREKVKEAEGRAAAFRSQSGLLIGQNNSVLATQQLAELSSELSRVRAARASAEAKAASIKNAIDSGVAIDTVPDVLSSDLIQRLRERQVQLNADIADMSTTLLDGHPRIKALKSQRSGLARQIQLEGRKILQSVKTEARTARFRENELIARLNELKAESARVGDEQVELRALERDAASQRDLLESYLTRFREASSRKDGNYRPVDARIFSRATTPGEPYFPKKLPIAAASFAGTLLIMALIILAQELFSGRAMRQISGGTVEPVRDVPMAPPVATAANHNPVASTANRTPVASTAKRTPPAPPPTPLPEVLARQSDNDAASRKSRPALKNPTDEKKPRRAERPATADNDVTKSKKRPTETKPTADRKPKPKEAPATVDRGDDDAGEHAIEPVAEQLVASGADRAVVVSPEGDEAAASSVLLAREVADTGMRVLLLDLTQSGAASRPMLDGVKLPGITNLLASTAQFGDVIHGDLYSDCHVIPNGTADTELAMRAIERLPIIMDSLTTAYDLVIVECGPTDADGIRRIVNDDAKVLMSVLEPAEECILETATSLHDAGHEDLILVTPLGYSAPTAPVPGRSVA